MIKLFNYSRSHIVSTSLFLALSCSAVFSQDARSPIGSWELSIARIGPSAKENGTVFLTFNADHTLVGYGLTTTTFRVGTFSGTWSNSAAGRFEADYTEDLSGDLFDGKFSGRATTGKRLEMNSVGLLGTFKLKGVPTQSLPDISGSWISSSTQTLTRSHSIETCQFTNLTQFPGVVGISGSGTNANRPFAVSGMAIVTAKGKVTVFKVDDFGGSDIAFDEFSGNFRQQKQTMTFRGNDTDGLTVLAVRARLSRP